MIIRLTPSTIHAEYKRKPITVYGEALLPGHGSPNFIIYSNAIRGWDAPHDTDIFTEEDKILFLDQLKNDLNDRNITFEIE